MGHKYVYYVEWGPHPVEGSPESGEETVGVGTRVEHVGRLQAEPLTLLNHTWGREINNVTV